MEKLWFKCIDKEGDYVKNKLYSSIYIRAVCVYVEHVA